MSSILPFFSSVMTRSLILLKMFSAKSSGDIERNRYWLIGNAMMTIKSATRSVDMMERGKNWKSSKGGNRLVPRLMMTTRPLAKTNIAICSFSMRNRLPKKYLWMSIMNAIMKRKTNQAT